VNPFLFYNLDIFNIGHFNFSGSGHQAGDGCNYANGSGNERYNN
jgi:hypothetical protein